MIRFKITLRGLGGITTPVAAMISGLPDLIEFSVKQSTLQGAKMIGQITDLQLKELKMDQLNCGLKS